MLQRTPPRSLLRLQVVLVAITLIAQAAVGESIRFRPDYAPGPADNPLRGFVPYAGKAPAFPHSLEFGYVSLASLMSGPNEFTWGPLDRLIEDVASRGCQSVLRIYIEYPRKPTGLPAYLVAAGVTLREWTNTNTQPLPPAVDHTPDYEDPRLRAALKSFIAAFGARYDGDPRIGFITAGLLGTWGEWHCFPHTDWFASKAVQTEVLDAYQAAFRRTPVLLRYPAGENDRHYAPTHQRNLGYHDDSFAWATLETGRKEDGWFFQALMRMAGTDALQRWRTAPIGGEIRPELWPCLWKTNGCGQGQDFARCVQETHASWLLDSSTSRPMTAGERERAIAAARSLGYELQVLEAKVETAARRITLTLTLTNRGVAPFYQDWPVMVTARGAEGSIVQKQIPFFLPSLQPGSSETRAATLDLSGLPEGETLVRVSIANPMKGGKPFRFANLDRSADPDGTLTLGTITLR